jgi:hypothetical protein
MRSLFLAVFSLVVLSQFLQPGLLHAYDTGTAIKIEKGDVAWSESVGAHNQIFFSSLSTEKNMWTAPVKITDDEFRNGHPAVDAGSDGKKCLVWVAGSDTEYMIHYSVQANNTWSKPAAVASTMKVNLSPSVMIDNSGQSWVVWAGNDGGQDEIYYSKLVGDKWTAPVRLNAQNEVPDILPEISLDENKIPQATWFGFRNGAYVKLHSTWDGKSWTQETEVQQSTAESNVQESASISNMPAFIQEPDKAFVRIYQSSTVK